jgi:uncharacterized RDD family membrane protein YckC
VSGGNWLPPTDSAPPLEESAQASPASAQAIAHTAHYLSSVGAAVVDFCVRLSIMLAVLLLVMAGGATLEQAWEITLIVGGVLAAMYAPIMIARTGGQTLGHQATETRIVRHDGTSLDGGGAVVREVLVKGILFEGLASVLLFIPTLVNYLWPLWDDNDEALHDKLCKTRVVEV